MSAVVQSGHSSRLRPLAVSDLDAVMDIELRAYPYPWTRGVITYGRPIEVPAKADADAIQACSLRLEHELNRITSQADEHFGHTFEL